MARPITLQSGVREFNQDITKYTGMLGGLTADIHTLRSLNPETTNRVLCVMYRGPYFMMQYLKENNNMYYSKGLFMTYKKFLEYYNTGIQVNMGSRDLAPTQLKGGFAGRQINIPTQQNAQTGQTLTINTFESVGRPITNFTNMWVDGIADGITGLTTYHGLVAGSYDEQSKQFKRIFKEGLLDDGVALEPSPAWEVAEFLIIALDRSGARVEGAVAAIGCYPQGKIGQEIFQFNNNGQSQILPLTLTFNCQFVESAYINDLATRYVRKFAIFGNSNNFNIGAGDAFFKNARSTEPDSTMFENKPYMDAVQSGVGNMPVFKAQDRAVVRQRKSDTTLKPNDHSKIYTGPKSSVTIDSPYGETGADENRSVLGNIVSAASSVAGAISNTLSGQ